MRDEVTAVLIASTIGIAIVVFVVAFTRRRAAAVRTLLLPLLTAAGWTNLEPLVFAGTGLKGTWRSFPVKLRHFGRQKAVPERLILEVAARTDARLIIKRRMRTILSRPLTLFGPPLVELQHTAAQAFWIRSDETALAERIFSNDKLVDLIGENIVASFDEVRIGRKGLRITRALDERAVRTKYNIAVVRMRFEPERFEPIAREELALSQALVDKLMTI